MLLVGQRLFGDCGGEASSSYGIKRIEAVGYDWIVVRVSIVARETPEELLAFVKQNSEDKSEDY